MSDEKVRETNEPWCIKIDEMIYDKKKNFDDIKDYLHTWGQKNILITLFQVVNLPDNDFVHLVIECKFYKVEAERFQYQLD